MPAGSGRQGRPGTAEGVDASRVGTGVRAICASAAHATMQPPGAFRFIGLSPQSFVQNNLALFSRNEEEAPRANSTGMGFGNLIPGAAPLPFLPAECGAHERALVARDLGRAFHSASSPGVFGHEAC